MTEAAVILIIQFLAMGVCGYLLYVMFMKE